MAVSPSFREICPPSRDQSKVAEGLMIVRIESNHGLEFPIRLRLAVREQVKVAEFVMRLIVVGLEPDGG
jgi:hypothetical protein